MRRKLKLGSVTVCLMCLTGCSILPELVAPVSNFAIGFYDHDDYYTKECLWYEEVKLNKDTKKWLSDSSPPEGVVKDLSQVSRNNDIYKEVCKKDKSIADKVADKANRLTGKGKQGNEKTN